MSGDYSITIELIYWLKGQWEGIFLAVGRTRKRRARGQEPVMLIGDLASQTGLSIYTINYYLGLGLIRAQTRSERSGYRLFGREAVRTLRRIMELRRKEIPLKEIIARKRNGLL